MKLKAIMLTTLLAGALLLLLPLSVQAATGDCTDSSLYQQFKGLANNGQASADIFPHFCDPQSAFKYISDIFLAFVGSVAVIFIMIGGFRMVIGGAGVGGEEGVAAGKKTLTWAVIGLIVVILSYAIVSVVVNFFTKGTV